MPTDSKPSIAYHRYRPPPLPIEKWAPLQNPEDIPSNMMRIPKEEIKKGLLLDRIILQDKKGHKRILVPECQRIALTRMKHETMLHLKGNRVHHELSRSYFWPHMAEEIKLLCSACKVYQQALVQRQTCQLLSDKPMKRTFLFLSKPMESTSTVTKRAKSSSLWTFARAKQRCGSCPIASKKTLQEL
jgi:hypothetical protein